jgi:hypothetical protein
MFVVLEVEDRAIAERFTSGEPYNAAGLFGGDLSVCN